MRLRITLLAITLALLPACSTKVFGPDGKKLLDVQGNATGISFTSPGTSFTADTLDHSTPAGTVGNIIRPSRP